MQTRGFVYALAAMALASCASTPKPAVQENTTFSAALARNAPAAAIASSPRATIASATDSYVDAWVLDVGQGLCVYVDCPDDVRPLLIDCGSNNYGDGPRPRGPQVAAWLHERAQEHGAMAVAISHPHTDHYNALPRLPIADVESVTVGGAASHYPKRIRDWAGDMRAFNNAAAHLNYGPLACGTDVQVDILTANAADRNPRANGDSLVIAITLGATSIILPGDAEGSTETQALAALSRAPHLPAPQTAIVSSHHGSSEGESNGETWFRRWGTDLVVFSAYPRHGHRHPRCAIVDRLNGIMSATSATSVIRCGGETGTRRFNRSTSRRMLSTHNSGVIRIRLTGSRITVACQVMSPVCSSQLDESELPQARTS